MKPGALATLWAAQLGPAINGQDWLLVRHGDEFGETERVPALERRRFEAMVSRLEHVRVGLAPRDGVTGRPKWACALWVHGHKPAFRRRLRLFEPGPTLVLAQTASVLTAIWALSESLPEAFLVKGNERLSAALKGVRRDAAIDAVVPFRTVVHHEPDRQYMAREIVGDLPDAPARYRPK